jgi:glyoxylate/hydroxypyruvate reductase A
MSEKVRILITFVIEPDLIRKIEEVDPRVEVLYEPDLLGVPRYTCDQHGTSIQHTLDQEERWSQLLSRAEIIFGYVCILM